MEKLKTTKIKIPREIEARLQSLANDQYTFDKRLRVALATGLFVEREISLAEAAKLAGMDLYEYMMFLKLKGIPAYEYTNKELEYDQKFIKDYQSQSYGKN
jgi:predicted HTH domain antitoxin